MLDHNASVLLIYTGGTIGMIEDEVTGALKSFDFQRLRQYVPELNRLKFNIDTIQFEIPIDSSDMNPDKWKKIVRIIEEHYDQYDGFVILHGTDTMAYSAAAISFMIENLTKPVILTGSQLPIGKIRTDGKENLITALEIAVDKDRDGNSFVSEVCIFFQNLLLRGNRTTKVNAANFRAFNSFNYPAMAEAGTYIKYRHDLIRRVEKNVRPEFHYLLDTNIVTVRIFPGIMPQTVKAMFAIPNLKGVILETYGSGNAPTEIWFLDIIREAVKKGIVVVNVTQCASGSVEMDRYESGQTLRDIGVVSGYDMTAEAAIAKLMFLFGHGLEPKQVKWYVNLSLAGEITID
jgi:L-asparaginase